MFIYMGKRITRRKLGYVADYCSVCRSPQAMHAREIREVDHIYWIPDSAGELLAIEVRCSMCKSFLVRATSFYAGFIKEPSFERALRENTTPDLDEYLDERTEIEERLHTGDLDRADRMGLIYEIIENLEYIAEKKATGGWSESITVVLVVLFIAGLLASSICASGHLTFSLANWLYGLTVVLLIVVFYRVTLLPNRVRSRSVMGLLARGLAPIDPSRDELSYVLEHASELKLGRSIRVDELIRQIESEVGRVPERSFTRSS